MSAALSWFKENASRFGGELRFDEPLSRHTYYRIGGPASVLAIPKGLDDLKILAEGLRATGAPVFFLGSGSNILVSDQGFAGVVVKMIRLNPELSAEGGLLRTGASVAVSSLLRRASQDGWGGLEMLTGIPGSIGGVVTMNAGTHLGEAKDRLKAVEVFPLAGGELQRFEGSALKFDYRANHFIPADAVVWAAEWRIELEEPGRVKARIDETLLRRKTTQPIDYPSCGSVFKNPREHGMHAWQVIDKLGLRGHRIGGAQIAEKHSNFIINLGEARAADVRALIDLAKSRAKAELGVELHEEVKFVGAF